MMQWTTEHPKEYGWYWMRVRVTDNISFTTCKEISDYGNGFEINYECGGYEWKEPFLITDVTHFMGPIDEPDPPKEQP